MERTFSQLALAKASIQELYAKIHVAKERKEHLVRYLKELWKGAEKGKFSREFCLKTEYNKVEGKTIREWILHYDNYIKECEAQVARHKKNIVKSNFLVIFISAAIIFSLAFSLYQFQPRFIGFVVQGPVSDAVSEANATVNTTQAQAKIGQPVRWTKTISLDQPAGARITLPIEATNITVKKISYSETQGVLQNQTSPFQEEPLASDANLFAESNRTMGSGSEQKTEFTVTGAVISETGRGGFLTRFFRNIGRMTGFAVQEQGKQVRINDTATEYEIEYETPAPAISSEEIIEKGKRIKVSGPDTIHYENVLVFTNISESLNVKTPSSIKIYWLENDTYINPASVQDKDSNGIYDYIEWISPSLSEQTFDIIVITKAEHLSPDRQFISDIYEEVKELDSIWSEEIPNQDYIRVTFKIPLDNTRDITLYPRVVSGTPKIEIYEKDEANLIAEFSSLTSNQYNKVFLTNLQGTQDIFDLKILDGSVEFDHIIDPSVFAYNVTTSLMVTDENNFMGTKQVRAMGYDSKNNLVFFGGNQTGSIPALYGFYNISSNQTLSLSQTDESNFIGTSDIRANNMAFDSANNITFIGGNNQVFGFYNISNNITKSLMLTDENNFISAGNIIDTEYDPTNKIVYISGAGSFGFGFYNISSNITLSLNQTDESNYIGTNNTNNLAYDSTNNIVYLGGVGGTFGFYNISNNLTKSLWLTDESNFIGTTNINILSYDSTSSIVYLGGASGLFGFYNISNNITKSLMLTDEGDFIGSNEILTLSYDPTQNIVYITGANGVFGFYNISSNTTKSLMQTDESNFIGTNGLSVLAYDSTNRLTYVGGTLGVFGVYEINRDPTSITLKYPDNNMNFTTLPITFSAIAVDPDDANGLNISIWGNWSGSWQINTSNSSSLNNTQTNFSINGIPNGKYIWSASVKDTGGATLINTTNYTFTLTSANAAPTIPFVQAIADQNATESSYTGVVFNFSVNDTNGASDINVSSVRAQFNQTGESTRSNTSCMNISSGGNGIMFTCNVSIYYFDNAGVWSINISARDNSEANAENSTTNFTYNLLTAMVLSPSALAWPSPINLTDTDTGSNNDPITINNTGNALNLSINITSYNLRGETDTGKFIFANNFTVENASQGCSGTAMSNATSLKVTTANLSRGNNSLSYGNETSGQEQIFFCLKGIPQDATAQSYSSSFYGPWEIRILLVALIPAANRKRKKKENEEIIENLGIPITVFSEKTGALESITKYMKENLGMSYHLIAEVLNRDQRTIWTSYKKAVEKQKQIMEIKETRIFLPASILRNRKLTILESAIVYLKEKGFKFSEIAKMLERDQRNIWAIYSRAKNKIIDEE